MVHVQKHLIYLTEPEQGKDIIPDTIPDNIAGNIIGNITDTVTEIIKPVTARSFYGQQCFAVLQHAQEYGEVFTLPKFLQVLYLSSFQEFLTEIPFTVQTEEIIGKSKAGNPVTAIVHGAGLLTPKRIRSGIILEELADEEIPDHGLTKTLSGKGQFALPFFDYEIHALLDGHILPVYQYSEFKKGISNLPGEYAVVRDFRPETEIPSGDYLFSELKSVPRAISLAGGLENLEKCLDMLNLCSGLKSAFSTDGKSRVGTRVIDKSGYLHPLHDLDSGQPQGRFMEIHGIHNLFYGIAEIDGPARFLSVKR